MWKTTINLRFKCYLNKMGKVWGIFLIKIKKPLIINRLKRVFVLEAGLEPARTNVHWILSPTCLPIPPLEPNCSEQ